MERAGSSAGDSDERFFDFLDLRFAAAGDRERDFLTTGLAGWLSRSLERDRDLREQPITASSVILHNITQLYVLAEWLKASSVYFNTVTQPCQLQHWGTY